MAPPEGSSHPDNGSAWGSAAAGESSAWGRSEMPLVLAGEDGAVHVTRPTASLARDLAQADAKDTTNNQASSEFFAPIPRRNSADDRPIRPAGGRQPEGGYSSNSPTSATSAAGIRSTPSQRRSTCSSSDRPIGGFGGGGGYSGGGASTGSDRPIGGLGGGGGYSGGGASTGSRSPVASAAGGHRGSFSGRSSMSFRGERDSLGGASPNGSSTPSGSQRRSVGGISRAAYDPMDALLNLGFDEESARAALAAAGGNVDKAIRLALDDSKAHDSFSRASNWEFLGDSGWVPFDRETDEVLQKASSSGKSACEVRLDGRHYLMDFDSLTQLNLDSHRTRKIRSRNRGSSSSTTTSVPATSSGAASLDTVASHGSSLRGPENARTDGEVSRLAEEQRFGLQSVERQEPASAVPPEAPPPTVLAGSLGGRPT